MKLTVFFTNTIKSFINNITYFYKKDNKIKVIDNESSTKDEERISDTQLSIISLTNAEYFEHLTETDNFFLMSLTQSLSDSQEILNAGYNPSLKVRKIINNLLLVDFAHNILKIPKEFVNTLNTNELADTLFSDKHHINKSIKLINFLGDNKLLLPDLLVRMENKYSMLDIFQEINFKNKLNHLSNDPYKKFRDKYLHNNFSSIFLSISDFFPNNKQHKKTETPELSTNSQFLKNNLIIKEQEKIIKSLYFDKISQPDKNKNKTSYKEKNQVFEDDETLEDSQIKTIQKDKIIKYYKLSLLEEQLKVHEELLVGVQNLNRSLSANLKEDKETYLFKEDTNNSLFVNTLIDKIIESKVMTPKEIFVQTNFHNKELGAYILLKYKEDIMPILKIDNITYMTKHFEKSLKKEDHTDFFDFLSSIQEELKSKLKDSIIQKLNSNSYNKAIEDSNFIKIGDILNLPSDFKEKLSNIQNKINELDNISLNIEQSRFLDSLKKEIISNIDNYTSIKEIDPNIDINSTIQSISDLEISIITFQKNIIDEQLKALQTNNSTLKVKFK